MVETLLEGELPVVGKVQKDGSDVDAGTTIVWDWTGTGISQNIVAEDGSFESELTNEAAPIFEHTFEAIGTYRYGCVPYER